MFDRADEDIDGDGYSNEEEEIENGSDPRNSKSTPVTIEPILSLSISTLPENLPVGTTVGKITALGPDGRFVP